MSTPDAPLTLAQERLWFLHQLDPADAAYAAYNVYLVHRLRGPLDTAALGAAFDALAARHEALRTCFGEVDGRPVQRVLPPAPVPIERIDVPDPAAAERLVADRVNTPFDLAAGPLLRVTLLRLADDDHVLCVLQHHLLTDGWSCDVLHRDLAHLYRAARHGEPVALPPLPLPFTAHARAERDRPADPAALAYWRDRLADPPALDLPTDRPRPPEPSSRGDIVCHDVPPDLAAGLADLARSERATLFMVLLAAYQVLLSRLSGQRDVCVGTPVAARDEVELEPLIGYLTDTLVMRADLAADPTFRELLGGTRRDFLAALGHRAVPFEELGRAPAFETVFTYQTSAGRGPTGPEFDGLAVEGFEAGYRQAKFDLLLDVGVDRGVLVGAFCYRTDLFDRATVERLGVRWEALLAAVVADPDVPVSRLPLLLPGEADQLGAWAEGPPLPPVLATVPDRVAATLAADPDAPAIACGGAVTTRGELAARAATRAAELRAAGVRPGDLVGVALPRSVDLIATLLAVWQAGAAYVPLEPDLPPTRRAALAAGAGLALLVTAAGPEPVPCVAARQAPGAAYVIHTSGSTGAPKGVLVDHDAVAARVAWMVPAYGLRPGDRVVQFAPVSVDAHVEEVWPALAAGATLVLLPDGPGSLPDVLAADPAISVLDLPTAYWHRLVYDLPGMSWPPALRLLILGGEQVDAAAVAAWRARHGDAVRLVNTYGPTEATVIATAAELTGGDSGRPPIGRPIGGVRAYVLDAGAAPVPVGLPGELCLAGAGLATGYLGLPAATAGRFAPDPYGPPGARLYRTGDRARWRPDGQLEFLGRLDEQVKVRGYRVEPGEVAACLRGHPAVGQAVVTARDGALVAHVTGTVTPAEVTAHAAAHLPAHLVPQAVVVLDALPLTRSGKVDVRALPARAPGARAVAPRTDAEHLVASVWAEVLGLDTVNADDDFFAIGGHSLHAVRVVGRLRALAEVDVPVRALFSYPTVAALATLVEELLLADLDTLTDDEAAVLLEEIR